MILILGGCATPGEKTAKHGTIIRFKPDPTIFEETSFSFDTLSNRLRELAFLNRGLKIVIEAFLRADAFGRQEPRPRRDSASAGEAMPWRISNDGEEGG